MRLPSYSYSTFCRLHLSHHQWYNALEDQIIFEQASAGISMNGTPRLFPAGARRYSAYIHGTARNDCK